jgi:3-oxoacyl-[acyl-carrier-protein] synthase III
MSARVVFPIAEDQQDLAAATLIRQLFGDGMVDGVVERGASCRRSGLISGNSACRARTAEGIHQFAGRWGGVAHQPQVVAEANQERTILGGQHVFKKASRSR